MQPDAQGRSQPAFVARSCICRNSRGDCLEVRDNSGRSPFVPNDIQTRAPAIVAGYVRLRPTLPNRGPEINWLHHATSSTRRSMKDAPAPGVEKVAFEFWSRS